MSSADSAATPPPAITALTDLGNAAKCRRIVVKIGSALLVGPDGLPRGDWLAALVAELARARAGGQQVIVVSSGAIALGAARLGLSHGGRGTLADAQAAAAVGQIALGGLWAECWRAHNTPAAQVLLTLEDLEDRRRYLNAAATLGRLLDAGAVPVVNENDTVATEEIRFGDNDRLAARVAQAAGADAVVLLSDVDGLYDRAPGQEGAALVPLVEGMTAHVRAMASASSSSGLGSGGMVSKLQAAEIAERAGIALAICNGRADAPFARVTRDGIGTLFVPKRKTGARKAWLAGRMRTRGTLQVDAGAARALADGGSLLAAGIVEVEGSFSRGDLVLVADGEGRRLAHGLSEYDAADAMRIIGHPSGSHRELLGYAPRSAVIHRDQLVML